MSLSTAILVNVVLDAAVLGALALVCRTPFRLGVNRAELRTASRAQHAQRRPLTEAAPQPPQ